MSNYISCMTTLFERIDLLSSLQTKTSNNFDRLQFQAVADWERSDWKVSITDWHSRNHDVTLFSTKDSITHTHNWLLTRLQEIILPEVMVSLTGRLTGSRFEIDGLYDRQGVCRFEVRHIMSAPAPSEDHPQRYQSQVVAGTTVTMDKANDRLPLWA